MNLAMMLIGMVMGMGFYRTMKQQGLSFNDPATRPKALRYATIFAVVAGLLLELVARYTG